MRHGVIQEISFCYGHRLMNYEGKCAHPHGHNGLAELTFESASLDARGMVVDFGDVKHKMKTWIDQAFDHQMLLRSDDPLVPLLREMREPIYVMEGNPTAENIAREIFTHAKTEKLPIVKVRLWETPTQSAVYHE